MLEQLILREHFSEILQMAQAAADHCDRLAQSAAGSAERQQFQRLGRDKRRHVELTERLLEIVSE